MHKLVGVLAVASAIFAARSARADLTLCSHFSNPIWAAWGAENMNTSKHCDSFNRNGFNICAQGTDAEWLGWYQIAPNSCVTVVSGCICGDVFDCNCEFGARPHMGILWFYASDFQGTVWEGNTQGPQWYASDAAFDVCINTGNPGSPDVGSDPNPSFGNIFPIFEDISFQDDCGYTFTFN